MLSVVIHVSAPGWMAQGIKEQLAMLLERWGDCQIVEVQELGGECPPATCQGQSTIF